MRTLFFLLLETKTFLICGFMLLFFTENSEAQLPIFLKDASNVLKSGTETIKSFNGLVNATIRTTNDFNKSVKVVKTTNPRQRVTKDQVTKPKFKKGKFTNFEWEPVAQFDGQIFPAMIISMATYKGEVDDPFMNSVKSSALGFRFNSKDSYIPMSWEIESVDKTYFDKVGGDFMYESQENYFMPPIPWNISVLARQVSSTPINIIFRLFDENGNKVEKSVPLFLRSVNDCIYQYKDKKFDFLFTAFIQEQHPEVDKILKEALNTKLISSVAGYQGSEAETILQVAAIWKVLHNRGFQYSSVTKTSTNNTENIISQQVRSFDNSLKSNQANCVDGTVVLATLLRAIGIKTKMILTSNHCFLGFYSVRPTKKTNGKILYLETTMMSHSDLIDKAKTLTQKDKAYVDQFIKAVAYAQKEYAEYKAADDLIEIDIDYYRNFIRPLPFQ